MVYGIILIVIAVIVTIYSLWIGRTREASIEYYEYQIKTIEKYGNAFHYTTLAIGFLINLSIIGYLIYAVTCV